MSDRPEITKQLALLLEKHINPHNDPRIYMSKEVTFDYASINPIRVDYMRFKPVNNTVSGIEKGDFYCYEIKSSIEDFNSKHGHNFIGDYNYYIMPEEVYLKVKDKIPYAVGVYSPKETPYGTIDLVILKKAKRKDRNRPLSEMLLMMFRSAARDNIKFKKMLFNNKDINMKRFKITQDLDYNRGVVKYGLRQAYVEANSINKVKEMLANNQVELHEIDSYYDVTDFPKDGEEYLIEELI